MFPLRCFESYHRGEYFEENIEKQIEFQEYKIRLRRSHNHHWEMWNASWSVSEWTIGRFNLLLRMWIFDGVKLSSLGSHWIFWKELVALLLSICSYFILFYFIFKSYFLGLVSKLKPNHCETEKVQNTKWIICINKNSNIGTQQPLSYVPTYEAWLLRRIANKISHEFLLPHNFTAFMV